jgi:hypothetical protein
MENKAEVSLNAWANITLAEWLAKIDKLGVGKRLSRRKGKTSVSWSYGLRKSLSQHVKTSSNGDFEKITFFYNFHGAFVDMGVGRGTKLGGVRDNVESRRLEGRITGNQRRAKKWYSKTMAGRTVTLSRLLQEKYGEIALTTIKETLPEHINLNL